MGFQAFTRRRSHRRQPSFQTMPSLAGKSRQKSSCLFGTQINRLPSHRAGCTQINSAGRAIPRLASPLAALVPRREGYSQWMGHPVGFLPVPAGSFCSTHEAGGATVAGQLHAADNAKGEILGLPNTSAQFGFSRGGHLDLRAVERSTRRCAQLLAVHGSLSACERPISFPGFRSLAGSAGASISSAARRRKGTHGLKTRTTSGTSRWATTTGG